MTRALTDRAHLSIGEVLSLLQQDFPDVTISKIRFLESQGLLDPERTPSGYRKFYDDDIDRLRWILRQQKDHYLPLKVIKDRLDSAGPPPTNPAPSADPPALFDDPGITPDAAAAQAPPQAHGRRSAPATGVGLAVDERRTRVGSPAPDPGAGRPAPSPRAAAPVAPPRTTPVRPTPSRSDDRRDRAAGPSPARTAAAATTPAPPRPTPPPVTSPAPAPARPARSVGRPTGEATGHDDRSVATGHLGSTAASVSFTIDELAEAAGLTTRDVRDLERFGLVEGFTVGDAVYYDGEALVMARTAAGFLRHGIEPRHMRSYKVAVDRESGLFEQIVLPLLKQRNPDARRRATETVVELVELGQTMRAALLRRELRDHLPPA